jgi:PiT family inorganic phosphate transporter
MEANHALLLAVIFAALAFDFINGFHDTANAIATSVLTRALTVPKAIILAASLNFIGGLVNVQVAKTISKGIVNSDIAAALPQYVVLAAIIGAIIWNLITWWYGLPSSSSHALVGGLVGAVLAFAGPSALWHTDKVTGISQFSPGVMKVVIAMIVSPLAGFVIGFIFMLGVMWIAHDKAPGSINNLFIRLQIASASFMAYSHGNNDAQKSMGIITMALVAYGAQPGSFFYVEPGSFHVPTWVALSCALMMALGTAMGGWRIIRTMGKKVMGFQPVHGFAAETTAASIIEAASFLGAPVSTTHVISSAILGVGSTKRLSAVRWGIAGKIVIAWVLTIPASAAMSAIAFYGLQHYFG